MQGRKILKKLIFLGARWKKSTLTLFIIAEKSKMKKYNLHKHRYFRNHKCPYPKNDTPNLPKVSDNSNDCSILNFGSSTVKSSTS